MSKIYLQKDVYTAANERIAVAFENFENVLVAFSGGKDSGVLINLCYEYAKQNGLLHKLAVYHEDYEAGYPQTFDYVERVFDAMPEIKRFWLCLPIQAACSASMRQTHWTPWHPDERDIWVREMPDKDYVYNSYNLFFPFVSGTTGFDFRIIFTREFAKAHGATAVMVGLRADESLSRLSVITSQHRTQMFNGLRYTHMDDTSICNFYPIYDWTTEDIWVANARFQWDYNKLYDLFYQSGMSIHDMRTASPFHHAGQKNLKLYRVIAPQMWGKMISRVNGVNFTGIYGGTTAMGWNRISKPPHFTWKQYAEFLIKTLPDETKQRLLYHLARFEKSWVDDGYGRNPDVIRTMEDEGIVLEKTGKISKLCTKDNIYEIVKIKSGFPDETTISDFRHCPSWKAVCITIMKNDFALQYMGCSRTKRDMAKRKSAIERYRDL
ncbi:phosphoadenosine phosphosulfate sulfurtransferase [Synergistales bacterium]|nr:phosphoadenosine phosphosulfate sulfurtransferase [Synergistales bacterium]